MEHRGSLLIGLLGFGFVAYVLIKLASQINTHPDLDHFGSRPTAVPDEEASRPARTATPNPADARHAADVQRGTMELLVDVAASEYVDRARKQLTDAEPWVSPDIPCTLWARGPASGDIARPERERRPGVVTWSGTFRCADAKHAYEVTFPVNLVSDEGRWEIEPETRKILSEGGFLTISWRPLSETERAPGPTPAPVGIGFPRRSGA